MDTNIRSTSSYVSARDARIKAAMAIFRRQPGYLRGEGRYGANIILGAHGLFVLVPFTMMANPLAGFALLGFGVALLLVGMEVLLASGRIANETLSWCMTEVDTLCPEFRVTMQIHKKESLDEEWSTGFIF